MLKPITWTGSAVRLLDQTRLPRETTYVDIPDEKQMHDAIRRLVVRGAPAIGCAAAFGAYLGVRNFPDDDATRFFHVRGKTEAFQEVAHRGLSIGGQRFRECICGQSLPQCDQTNFRFEVMTSLRPDVE